MKARTIFRRAALSGRSRRGITAVEVLVGMAIVGTLLTGLLTTLLGATNQWALSKTKISADNDASLALQRITADLRVGIRASVSTDKNTLTVVRPSINSAGDYDRYTDGASVTYYLSSGYLYQKVGSAAAAKIGKNLTDVEFTMGASAAQVVVKLTSRQTHGSKYGQTSFTTTITLRNDTSDPESS